MALIMLRRWPRLKILPRRKGPSCCLIHLGSGYVDIPWGVMQGYTQSATEVVDQLQGQIPTKIFLQAGVGGLAAAAAAVFRKAWGDRPQIIVVEPTAAPALQASITQRRVAFADGPVSNMGRLDCKEPSVLALKSLARDANAFLTIEDEDAANTVAMLRDAYGHSFDPQWGCWVDWGYLALIADRIVVGRPCALYCLRRGRFMRLRFSAAW